MITPSATAPTSAACSGVPMPKPDGDGDVGLRLGRGDELGEVLGQRVALARGAGVGDQVDEALARRAQISSRRSGGVVGRHERHEREPAAASAARTSPASSGGRSGTIAPATPCVSSSRGELLGPAREDHVRVDHQHDRAPERSALAARSSTESSVAPARSAAVAAEWITGPSASGSENGTPSSITSAPAVRVGGEHGGGRLGVREAAHQVGHQGRPALGPGRVEGRADPLGAGGGRGLSHRARPGGP